VADALGDRKRGRGDEYRGDSEQEGERIERHDGGLEEQWGVLQLCA
jgi:hypothetical protein